MSDYPVGNRAGKTSQSEEPNKGVFIKAMELRTGECNQKPEAMTRRTVQDWCFLHTNDETMVDYGKRSLTHRDGMRTWKCDSFKEKTIPSCPLSSRKKCS